MNMNSRSAKALVASRRNLALRSASYCKHCSILVPDCYQEAHLREAHGIVIHSAEGSIALSTIGGT